jgi:hypothetical protein
MSLDRAAIIEEGLQSLLADVVSACKNPNWFGSVSGVPYDTAWLAMVSKEDNGNTHWLFPQCFDSLIASQSPQGGWGFFPSGVDAVLNTLAALLAFKTHMKQPERNVPLPKDMGERFSRGVAFLNSVLQD